ncbi:hypothetical protein I553_6770 [Mycobacterium xenopi 4042]|uniref:Uncharacterized protein n=1 Tax=Mycobacterium xenopi 4042 TaxID=1299334 RepID=X7Z3N3_MYCXE|nr:hypothetical protein I553_6770 [Mycobacterium xenopi 4042]
MVHHSTGYLTPLRDRRCPYLHVSHPDRQQMAAAAVRAGYGCS